MTNRTTTIEGKGATRPRQPKNPTTNIVDLDTERTRRRPPTQPHLLLDLIRAANTLLALRADADGALFIDATDAITRLGSVYAAINHALNELSATNERSTR